MSYTPGPWWVEEGHAEVFGPHIMAAGIQGPDALAAVDDITSQDAEADARLIAAAPELLEALETTARRLHSARHGNIHSPDDFSFDNCGECAAARAAIDKARGKQEAAPPK